jgi:hypothetical protein
MHTLFSCREASQAVDDAARYPYPQIFELALYSVRPGPKFD